MPSEDFALSVLEFPRIRELVGRFLLTPLARGYLERLVPFTEREKMEGALAQVRELVPWLEEGHRLPLAPVADLRPLLEGLHEGSRRPDATDLAELLRALRCSTRLKRILGESEGREALKALASRLPHLEALTALVENTIDERGGVLTTASPKLSKLRAEIRRAEAGIQTTLSRLLEDPALRHCLRSPQVAWRNGRPMLQIKMELHQKVPGILHDRSQSGQTAFVEPEAVVAAANRLASIRTDEAAEVQRLLAEMFRSVNRERGPLLQALEGMAWIDFSHARARLVRELGFRVPRLGEEGRFRIRRARHPLLLLPLWLGSRSREEAEAEVVPLDLDLGGPFTMLVITGPNTGGKTVALKTVGLLQLMAQAGMPLPASGETEVPFVEGVYADIGDEQEIEQNLSTFSSHLTRIRKLLDRATPRCLVLLDELGAGTDPEEGGALGYALLELLHERKIPTLASTHLGRLKDFAYQHRGVENGAMAFDSERLEPLFRLDLGLPGFSNALSIAERMGFPGPLIERAGALLGERDGTLEEMIDRVQRTRRAAEEQRREAEKTRLRMEDEEAELEGRAREMEAKEVWIQEEAERFVEEELRRARELLVKPMKQLLNAPQPFGEKARGLLKLIDHMLSNTSLWRRRERYLEGVKKGHMVYVPRYRRRCKVLKVDRGRKRLNLEMGGLQIEVSFEDVSWVQPLDGP